MKNPNSIWANPDALAEAMQTVLMNFPKRVLFNDDGIVYEFTPGQHNVLPKWTSNSYLLANGVTNV